MNFTEEENKKLDNVGFYPKWGDLSHYVREVSYGDCVEDDVYKWSENSYSVHINRKEWDDGDYYWQGESEEFKSFESLINFLEE